MESKIDSDNAVFWVEVADDLSSNNATIYIYYGKSDATTTSNGDNTFLFFDDFNDLSKWTVGSGTWTIEDGTAKCTASGRLYRAFANSDLAIRYRAKVSNAADYWRAMVGYRTNAAYNQGYRAGWGYHSGAGYKMHLIDREYWRLLTSGSVDWNVDTWYVAEARAYGSSHKHEILGSVISATDTTRASNTHVVVEASSATSAYPIWFDWYLIRKYVDPEPSHGSWGSEEVSFAQEPYLLDVLLSSLKTKPYLVDLLLSSRRTESYVVDVPLFSPRTESYSIDVYLFTLGENFEVYPEGIEKIALDEEEIEKIVLDKEKLERIRIRELLSGK